MPLVVTDCPSLDWIRDVPPDISVRLVRTTRARIVVALWCEAADSHIVIEYEAYGDPTTAVAAAVVHLRAKANMEDVIREASKPMLLVH